MLRTRSVALFVVVAVLGLMAVGLASTTASGADEGPLGPEDFTPLATGGFTDIVDGDAGLVPSGMGNEFQVFAWSMAYFDGALFVGTGTIPTSSALTTSPPEVLERWRAEIWRYDFGGADGTEGHWTRVHRSPLVPLFGMLPSPPKDFGYRAMTICDGRLFVTTNGIAPRILVSSDGETFGQVNLSGLPTGQLGYRALSCLDGTLVTSPIGTTTNPDIAPTPPLVFANADPLTRPWVQINHPGFGDDENEAIFSMTTWDRDGDGGAETLVASTVNNTTGAQVWVNEDPCALLTCAGAENRWEKLISHGAGRPFEPPWVRSGGWGPHNAGAGWMTEYQGDVWIGFSSAASSGHGVGLGEIVRLHPDGTWELVAGMSRSPWPGYNTAADFSDLGAIGGSAASYAAIDLGAGIAATTFFTAGPETTVPYPLAGNSCDPVADATDPACSPSGDRGVGMSDVTHPAHAPPGFAEGAYTAQILDLYAQLNTVDGIDLAVPSPVEADWEAIHPLVREWIGFERLQASVTAGYVWQLTEHDGLLYVSTLDRATPPDGFDIVATAGGQSPNFVDVMTTGFGNPLNIGGRTMVSTDSGLAVGTLNLAAFRGLSGAAGADVWLGN